MTVVILSEAKNLIIPNESTIEILRLTPQNDIATQSPFLEEGYGGVDNKELAAWPADIDAPLRFREFRCNLKGK